MTLLTLAALGWATDAALTPEQQRQDYDEMWVALEKMHPSLYLHTPKAAFDEIRAEVRDRLGEPRSAGAFWTVVMDALTPIGCGHTQTYPSEAAMGNIASTVFPRDLMVLGGELYVDPRSHEDAGRIVSIQGVPAADVLEQLRGLVSSDALDTAWQDYQTDVNGHLFIPLLFGEPDSWELVLEIDGQEVPQSLQAAPPGNYYAGSEPGGHLRAPRYEAVALDITTGERFPATREALTGRALLLTFDSFDGRAMEATILKPLRTAIKAGASGIIIDLRRNGGGSPWPAFDLFGHFIEKRELVYDQKLHRWPFWAEHRFGTDSPTYAVLTSPKQTAKLDITDGLFDMGYGKQAHVKPRKPTYDGPAIVLTSSESFSTAADLAALFKRFGRGQIVGTRSGGSGTLQTSGEEVALVLSHSGTRLWVPLNRSRLVDPEGRIGRAGVTPDHVVQRTFEDVRDDADPALEKARALLREAAAP